VSEDIYDDEDFFAAYEQLGRSVHGLDGAPEWSSVRALLPDLVGAHVVDLGCGFGAFARWAADAGAIDVLALDASARMLERARATTDDPSVRYELADLNELVLPAASFDLAYSALVVHYLADISRFARAVHDALRPGGRLVLTTEHPVFMASTLADFVDVDGVRTWPLDHYADEGERTTNWLVPGVRKWFRSAGATVNALIDAGFVIRRLIDWTPSTEAVAADPALAKERDRPAFLLVAADRARR
jgi:2-polyprenyl-3-methyl-5-hydroxy-6-metoxy-1,4-benzoquinol methylase